MKKVSKILLTIGGILNIIGAVGAFISGIVLAIMSFAGSGFLIEYMREMAETMPEDMGVDPAIIIGIIAGLTSLFTGIILFVLFLVSGCVALKAPKKNQKGSFIACIVWSVLTESIFLLVGGIFGLIGLNQEQNAAQAEPEPAPAPAPAPAAIEEKKAEPVKEEPKAEAPKEEKKVREDWYCPNCGAHNTGKFCQACGTKRPE